MTNYLVFFLSGKEKYVDTLICNDQIKRATVISAFYINVVPGTTNNCCNIE